MNLLVDTHIWLWRLLESERLSENIEDADREDVKHYTRLAALAEEEGLMALKMAMEDEAADEDEHRQEMNMKRLLEDLVPEPSRDPSRPAKTETIGSGLPGGRAARCQPCRQAGESTPSSRRGVTSASTRHDEGTVGRDDGRVKVFDFGLATPPERDPTSGAPPEPDSATALETVAGGLTKPGRILGTVVYMSPEQAEGSGVDQRSDVFALGIMLYEMAAGRRPFQGETRLALLSSIVTDTPPPISDVRPRVPGALDRIVRRCLQKKPDNRALAQEAIAALNALEGDLDGSLEQLAKVDTPISLLLAPSIGLLAGRWQLAGSQLDAL